MGGDDEPPLAREGIDDVGKLCAEALCAFVEAVQMEAGIFFGVGEDVFFKRVIAELAR